MSEGASMTPELRQYLTEWYEWATGDAVEGKPFSRGVGLCHNAPHHVAEELIRLFKADTGRTTFPFGNGYCEHAKSRTQHLCPKRLAWVASKIGLPATEQADNRADQAKEDDE